MSCHRSEPSTVHRSSALPSEGRRPSSPATGRDALRSATPGQGAPSSRHDAGPPIGPGRRCRPAGTAPHFREGGADAAGSDLEAATGSRASRCDPARSAPWYVDGHGSPRRRVAEKRDPSVPPPPGGHRRRAPTPQGAVRRRRRCRPSSRTTEVRSDPDRAIRAPIMSLNHLRVRDIETTTPTVEPSPADRTPENDAGGTAQEDTVPPATALRHSPTTTARAGGPGPRPARRHVAAKRDPPVLPASSPASALLRLSARLSVVESPLRPSSGSDERCLRRVRPKRFMLRPCRRFRPRAPGCSVLAVPPSHGAISWTRPCPTSSKRLPKR